MRQRRNTQMRHGRGGSQTRPRGGAPGNTIATNAKQATRRALALLILLAGLLALPIGASAHTGTPVKQERVQAGPYALDLRSYSAPRAGQTLLLLVLPVGDTAPTTLTVTAEPGPGVDATAARVRTAPDPDNPAGTDAAIPLAVTGLWVITIAADGPAGHGQAQTYAIAAAPNAVPEPVGWALGLSPLIGLVGFAAAQRRWLNGVRNAE